MLEVTIKEMFDDGEKKSLKWNASYRAPSPW